MKKKGRESFTYGKSNFTICNILHIGEELNSTVIENHVIPTLILTE